jgi:hypothetical protein
MKTNNKKTLFDHVNQVLYNRELDYMDKLDQEDEKTFSSFMVNRIISNDLDGAYYASILDKVLDVFSKKGYYKMATNLLPNRKYNTFPSKKTKEDIKIKEAQQELLRCVKLCYVDVSEKQAKEYISILTTQQKHYILELYSKDSEKFTKHIT